MSSGATTTRTQPQERPDSAARPQQQRAAGPDPGTRGAGRGGPTVAPHPLQGPMAASVAAGEVAGKLVQLLRAADLDNTTEA